MTAPFRTFRSVCDVCLADVDGDLVAEGPSVYLRKHCPEHGERRVLLSRNGADYLAFDRSYHVVFPPDEAPPATVDTCYFITNACNQGCTYCATEANLYPYFHDYSVERFTEELASYAGTKVSLIGGEPFRHPRVFDFVRAIRDAGKTTVFFTNGIALADRETVRELVSASGGRCEIRMTFEGFRAENYAHLPVPRLVEKKLAALRHLAEHGVPATLGHTIEPTEQRDVPGVQRTLRELIEYAMREEFVRGLTFQGTAALGGSRFHGPDDVMSVDQTMDAILAACPVPMKRRDVYLTQRLIHLTARLFELPMCEYVQAAVLARVGGRWVGLDHFFDCDALERRLDARMRDLPSSRARLARALAADLLASARKTRIPDMLAIGAQLLPVFANKYDFASIPRCVLPLLSISVCDRYNLDSTVARRCEKMVHTDVGGRTITESCSDMAIRHLRERTAGDVRDGRTAARRRVPLVRD